MNQKWQDARAWEERNLRGVLLPVRWAVQLLGSWGLVCSSVLLVAVGVVAGQVGGIAVSMRELLGAGPVQGGLWLVVVSAVLATLRRVEFTLPNVGRLLAVTGLVLCALGALHFGRHARRGDLILESSAPSHAMGGAFSEVGPPASSYFDAERLALYVHQGQGWESRILEDIPRNGNYNLGASGSGAASAAVLGGLDVVPSSRPPLSIDVPAPGFREGRVPRVEPKLKMRVIGYAARAEERADWLRVEARSGVSSGEPPQPLRFVTLHGPVEQREGAAISEKPGSLAVLRPTLPKERHGSLATDIVNVEYTLGSTSVSQGGMDEARWRDLSERLPLGAEWGLVVEAKGAAGESTYRHAFCANLGDVFVAGQSGYRVEVKELNKRAKTPIVAPGYIGCESSEAVLRITKPDGTVVERRVYHRYPEIAHDWSTTETGSLGTPAAVELDRNVSVSLIDCSSMQVYLNESEGSGKVRAIVRQPAGGVQVVDDLGDGRLALTSQLQLRVGERWADSRAITRPVPIVGVIASDAMPREQSMLAIELTHDLEPAWNRIVWLPFVPYFEDREPGKTPGGPERSVDLPDGTRLWLAYGRQRLALPGAELRFAGFNMTGFDERGEPRDVEVKVKASLAGGSPASSVDGITTKLLAMELPFAWSTSRGFMSNVLGVVKAGLNPNQFSARLQDWDVAGWKRTNALVQAGRLSTAQIAYVKLDISSGPGVPLIKVGAVLVALGAGWGLTAAWWRGRLRGDRSSSTR